jgi:starch phosphorylase
MGGVRVLRALGFDRLTRFHMNQGHAALLTMELLHERREADGHSDIPYLAN